MNQLTIAEQQRLQELQLLSSCPPLQSRYSVPKPVFESTNGASCTDCHFTKGRAKHVCNPDLVDDGHTWAECVADRHSFVAGHSDEKLRRETALLTWREAKDAWETLQRANHDQDKRLWKIAKELAATSRTESKKKRKRKVQFENPTGFAAFTSTQELDGQ